ncbi:MAG: nitroreductase [Planctomycetota bacterium]|nr:nitroreductase [Planctomycetota bacterium]
MSVLAGWQTIEQDFPRNGSWEEQACFCLQYALLAPSTHNAQPWLFRIRAGAIELQADRSRGLAVSDPFDRELSISCGAALFNLRIALQRFGFQVEVEVVPRADDPDLLARVTVVGRARPAAESRLLFQAIPRRHTNRGSFDSRPVSPRILHELVQAARREGAWLEILEGDNKLAAADLVAEGDRVQLADPHFRRELSAWQSDGRGARADGLSALGLPTRETGFELGPLLIRTFDWYSLGRPAQDRELALGSPVLAVLGTRHEETSAWLAAGQALQHILLGATIAGVHASFLNQAIEVSALRQRLCALTGCVSFPQILLRMGHSNAAPATPRRKLEDVLLR